MMLEEGERYAVMLYTWRSCSRAVPSVSTVPMYSTIILFPKCSYSTAACGWLTDCSVGQVLLSGHPQEAAKVSVIGAATFGNDFHKQRVQTGFYQGGPTL